MVDAILSEQVIVTVDNRVGTLAEVTTVISSSGINLIAICAQAVDNKGFIMFVSENNKQAQKLLKAKKYNVREEEVVLITLDNKPGALRALSEKIASYKIDLTLLYGTVEKEGDISRLVIVSENNEAVLMAVNMAS